MRERQDRERSIGRPEREHPGSQGDVAVQVAVRQHDALRRSRGARRIDQGREVLGRGGSRMALIAARELGGGRSETGEIVQRDRLQLRTVIRLRAVTRLRARF